MVQTSDRRKIALATISVAASRMLGFPLALLVSMWLTRALSKEEFAFFGVLASVSLIFAMFAQAGFQTSVVRLLGEAEAGDDTHSGASIIYASTLVTILAGSVLAGAFYLAGRGILPSIPGATDWLFLLAALLLVARSLNTLAAQALRGIGRVGMSANFSGQGPQGGIVRCILILAGFAVASQYEALTLEMSIWISIGASVVCAVMATAMALMHTGWKVQPRDIAATAIDQKRDNFNIMLSEAMLYWASASSAVVIGGIFVDAALMAAMVAAFQLRNIITSPLTIIAGAVPSILIRLYKEGDKVALEQVLRTTASAAFLLCLVAVGALAAIGPGGFRWLFGPDYGAAYFHFLIMAAGIVYFVYCGLPSQTLLLLGDVAVHRRAMLKVLAITTFAYLGLVYIAGAYGLSIGLALSLIVQQVFLLRAGRRTLGVDTRAYLDPREYAKAPALLRELVRNRKNRDA